MKNLELCAKCGKHACLVGNDGFKGIEFGFKRLGRMHLASGLAQGVFRQEQAEEIRTAIDALPLPENWEEVNVSLLWQLEFFNQMRAKHNRLSFHECQERGIQNIPIPDDFETVLEATLCAAEQTFATSL